MEKNKIDA